MWERLQVKAFRDKFIGETVAVQLGAQLRLLRISRGMSAEELAAKVDCSVTDIGVIEQGISLDCEMDLLLSIAEVFDVALIARFVSFGEMLATGGHVPAMADDACPISPHHSPGAEDVSKEVLGDLEQLLTEASENGFTPEIEQAFMDGLPGVFARVRALEEAMERIAEGDIPRTEGEKWRKDGQYSKLDRCSHGPMMNEDCGDRISDFARAALTLKETDDVG